MALLIRFFSFFSLKDVKLAEKVESDDSVNIDDDSQKHDRQDKFFAIMSDGL